MTEIYHGVTIYIPAVVVDTKDAGNIVVEACGKRMTFGKRDLENVCLSSYEVGKAVQAGHAAADLSKPYVRGKKPAIQKKGK